jgi:hypothetical protein
MTTFTTEDRKKAYDYDPGLTCVTPSGPTGLEEDLVAEAPYHPGYESAVVAPKDDFTVVNTNEYNKLLQEVEAYRKANARQMAFTKTIVNSFRKG